MSSESWECSFFYSLLKVKLLKFFENVLWHPHLFLPLFPRSLAFLYYHNTCFHALGTCCVPETILQNNGELNNNKTNSIQKWAKDLDISPKRYKGPIRTWEDVRQHWSIGICKWDTTSHPLGGCYLTTTNGRQLSERLQRNWNRCALLLGL